MIVMRMDGLANGGSTHSAHTKASTSSSDVVSRPDDSTNGSEAPVLQLQLVHDPGITADWSIEEQTILEDGLAKFANETSNLFKYIKVANLLPEKTVRDVAMRCRWMTKKEIGKRRKQEDKNAHKKNKENKNQTDAISNITFQENHARNGMPSTGISRCTPDDYDDDISNDAIGGKIGQLLDQNAQIIAQIRENIDACKITETRDHLLKLRDNIFTILNGMEIEPQVMSQMPPLPVNLHTQLADTVLSLPFQAARTSQ